MGLREIVAETSDPASVMERVVAETVTLVPDADGAAIAVCRDDGPLCFTVAAGNLEGFVGTELPLDGSLSGIAVRSGVVQHSSDTTADPRVDSAASRALGISSMICVPLRRGDERIGVLNVASRRPGAFGPADEANLDKLAGFVSTVVGAAIDLASVTSRLLGADEPVGAADDPSPRGQVAYSGARGVFVANVVRPGAAVGSAARDRIEMVLTGGYHQFGEFASDIAALSRIVTLHNIEIKPLTRTGGFDSLSLTLTANTYRYLTADEMAAQNAKSHQGKFVHPPHGGPG